MASHFASSLQRARSHLPALQGSGRVHTSAPCRRRNSCLRAGAVHRACLHRAMASAGVSCCTPPSHSYAHPAFNSTWSTHPVHTNTIYGTFPVNVTCDVYVCILDCQHATRLSACNSIVSMQLDCQHATRLSACNSIVSMQLDCQHATRLSACQTNRTRRCVYTQARIQM
jgi:hypothetical protein